MFNYEYIGNIHIHSVHSDGSNSIAEIAKKASNAGLDFICINDHEYMRRSFNLSEEGFYGNILALQGLEIGRKNHHYLAYQFYVKAWAYSEDLCEKEAIEEKLESIREEKLLKFTDQDVVEFNHELAQGYSLLYEGDVKKALQFLEEAEKQAFHLKLEKIGVIKV